LKKTGRNNTELQCSEIWKCVSKFQGFRFSKFQVILWSMVHGSIESGQIKREIFQFI